MRQSFRARQAQQAAELAVADYLTNGTELIRGIPVRPQSPARVAQLTVGETRVVEVLIDRHVDLARVDAAAAVIERGFDHMEALSSRIRRNADLDPNLAYDGLEMRSAIKQVAIRLATRYGA